MGKRAEGATQRSAVGYFTSAVGVFAALLASCGGGTPERAPRRPNIVIFLTDDSGYSDLGCFGGEIATPHLDGLARDGLRFSHFYTNAKCSPTRASLLTGRYPQVVGAGDLCQPEKETPFPGYRGYLSLECTTLAEALRAAGYRTWMVGKWHLGGTRGGFEEPLESERSKWPTRRGFDRFYGILHSAANYFRPVGLRSGEELVEVSPDENFYATRALTDRAVRWIEEGAGADEPFFLYVAHMATHEPLQAPEKSVAPQRERYRRPWNELQQARLAALAAQGFLSSAQGSRLPDAEPDAETAEEMAVVAAMTAALDESVGAVVDALRRVGDLDDTLILYLSDNGAGGATAALRNTPLPGGKGRLAEGGIRTHAVLSWPSRVRSGGRVVHDPAHVIDVMPTCLEAAGVAAPPEADGVSLLPVIESASPLESRRIFLDLYGAHAVIEGDWKYHRRPNGEVALYDLASDPAARTDVSARHPERVTLLSAAHEAWRQRNHVLPYGQVQRAQQRPAHRWGGRRRGRDAGPEGD